MGRSVLILLRLSMIAGAFALLFFCVRAASAQQASDPVRPQQAQPYGFVPVQDSAPETQPYGIKPIPGYTPPPATEPPQQLRGSFEDAPPLRERQPQNAYGYVPLRQTAPAPLAQQPQLRTNATAYDNNAAVYENASNNPRANDQDPAEAAHLNAGYQLGPGDKIRVTVFGESDLSGEYQVDGSGMVRLPLIGTLRADRLYRARPGARDRRRAGQWLSQISAGQCRDRHLPAFLHYRRGQSAGPISLCRST